MTTNLTSSTELRSRPWGASRLLWTGTAPA